MDGEMRCVDISERLKLLRLKNPGNLTIISSEILYLDGQTLNINSSEDQEKILRAIEDFKDEGRWPDVIIFDNLSSLVLGADESDNSALDGLLKWLWGLRHADHAVIIVHHAGKNGDQRGASRREDQLDTVIKLKKPDSDEAPSEGARFTVTFPKTRGKKPIPSEFIVSLVQHPDGFIEPVIEGTKPKVSAADEVLKQIALHAPKTQAELVVLCGRSKGSISVSVAALRRKKFIEGELEITDLGIDHVLMLWPDLSDKFPKGGLPI